MQVWHGELSDITRYLKNHEDYRVEDYQPEFDRIAALIRRFRLFDSTTSELEIGIGIGWFPILCAMNNIPCQCFEISTQLVESAQLLGSRYGLTFPEPDSSA